MDSGALGNHRRHLIKPATPVGNWSLILMQRSVRARVEHTPHRFSPDQRDRGYFYKSHWSLGEGSSLRG